MSTPLSAADAISQYHRVSRAVGEAARLTLGIDDVPALPQAIHVLDGIAAAVRQSARSARLIEGMVRAPSVDVLADVLDKSASAAQRGADAIEAALELVRQLALTTKRRVPGPVTQEKILQIDAAIAEALKEQRP